MAHRWRNRIRTIDPAPAKASSGRCRSDRAARKAEPLTGSGPRRRCLHGVAPHSLSLQDGPRVRIHLPAAENQQRTVPRFGRNWSSLTTPAQSCPRSNAILSQERGGSCAAGASRNSQFPVRMKPGTAALSEAVAALKQPEDIEEPAAGVAREALHLRSRSTGRCGRSGSGRDHLSQNRRGGGVCRRCHVGGQHGSRDATRRRSAA